MWNRATKRQPTPDESLPFPVSTAFVRHIHELENHANNEWWPVHCEEMDFNFLHAAYTEDDITI